MSYFNDELRDVMGSIKNGQSASGLDFFIELKRKINNGYEIYSEFNLELIFSDITLKNEFSHLLSFVKIERIILRSISKNKNRKISIDDFITNIFESNIQFDFKKYIRGGEFYSGAGSVVGRQVKVGKTDGVQRGAINRSIENDRDRKVKDTLYYIKPTMVLLILGSLFYFVVLSKSVYQFYYEKYAHFSSDVKSVVNYVFKKSNGGSDVNSTEFGEPNPISEKSNEVSDSKSSDVEGTNLFPVNQKIIWQWSGSGVTIPTKEPGGVGMIVRSGCGQLSEDLDYYLQNGWKIQSTNSAERAVTGGVCIGRDIVISRE
jgi:hypothetical protein